MQALPVTLETLQKGVLGDTLQAVPSYEVRHHVLLPHGTTVVLVVKHHLVELVVELTARHDA